MEKLRIKYLDKDHPVSLNKMADTLEKQTVLNPINIINWEKFSYHPKVSFRIAHNQNEICLIYYVNEKYILAKETNTNGEVYKDSCVEFFISFDNKNYYNFEFNCIGTIHLAYGSGRGNRKFVSTKIINKIEIESSLGNQPFNEKKGNFEWKIMIRIPVECFEFSNLKSLNGLKATANFYKCGDYTTQPHFLTWQPIASENPDYHRPEYFGQIFFEE